MLTHRLTVVVEVGLEPTQPQRPKDFKSFVSTIPPFDRLLGASKPPAEIFYRCKGK